MRRTELQIQLALAEVAQSHARARHFELRLMTGAYKDRKVFKGPISDGVLLTEGELALDEVMTHDAHIRRAEDLLDHVKRLLAIIPPDPRPDKFELVDTRYPGRMNGIDHG